MARPVQPFLSIRENLKDADRSHSLFQKTLERAEANRVGMAPETLEHRPSLIDTQIFVLWVTFIRDASRSFQLSLQRGDKSLRLRGNPRAFRIRCQILPALLFTHELLSEIAVAIATGDTKVAGLQLPHHLRDRAQFEPTPGDHHRMMP
ncbi:MAG: hypothetical protein JWQ42_4818 [Edaphobacter sp.]|nr:hypothetical protein [Edaphobacter sp.]